MEIEPSASAIIHRMPRHSADDRIANTPIARNLAALAKAAGYNYKSLSLAAGIGETYVREIVTGRIRKPSFDKLSAIASVLQVPIAAITEAPDIPSPLPTKAPLSPDLALGNIVPPAAATLPRDLPVMGTAAGSAVGAFQFEGGVVDMVRRPPALAGAKDVYAIYVVGDSMQPQHNDGELRFVHPHRPIHIGDTVIIQTRTTDHEPPQAYIKNLVRRGAEEIVVAQLNPEANIAFRTRFVVAMHKVLTMNELFGI
jgi:phage repressor protein C with HTH and peptisase S24 domain